MVETGKTVLILVSYGIVVRDVLRTELWATLKKSGHRFIIASPLYNDPAFHQEFSAENVVFVPLASYRPGMFEAGIRELHKLGFYSVHKSATLPLQELRLYAHKPIWRFLRKFVAALPVWNERVLGWLRSVVQHRIRIAPQYRELFSQYKPDLVFSTMPFLLDEQPILRLANQLSIPIVARIHSWDNLSSKGAMLEHFSKVLVWNQLMQNEVLRFYPTEYTSDDIVITGVPQFDYYFSYQPITKADFFAQLGITNGTRLVLFSTAHKGISPQEPTYIQQAYDILLRRGEPFLLYVRLHPRDTKERYAELQKLPHILIEYPGQKNATLNDTWNPIWEDMKHFVHLLRYADVNINVASTVTIDAAVFGTPIINLAYDTVRLYYQYEHYRPIVATGGVVVVQTPTELEAALNDYLADRTLQAAGRKRIVEQELHYTDGQSGQRTATAILAALNLN